MDWLGRVRWGNVAWLAFVVTLGVLVLTRESGSEAPRKGGATRPERDASEMERRTREAGWSAATRRTRSGRRGWRRRRALRAGAERGRRTAQRRRAGERRRPSRRRGGFQGRA